MKALRQRYNTFLEEQKKNNNETEIKGMKIEEEATDLKRNKCLLGITV